MTHIRRFAILALMFFTMLAVKGQVGESRSRLGVGVNGGMAFNTISFDPTIKQFQHKGLSFGLSMRYTCEKYFTTICALQAEINYTQLGWKEEILDAYGAELEDTYQRDMNYIQLPLLCRLGWGKESSGLQFFILLGPQFGYYISSSAKQSDIWTLNSEGHPNRPNNVYQQYDMKDPDNKFEYGLTGGLGLEFSTKHGQHIMVDGRYYYGLSDIFDNGKKDVFARSAHMTISARLTYLFDLFNK